MVQAESKFAHGRGQGVMIEHWSLYWMVTAAEPRGPRMFVNCHSLRSVFLSKRWTAPSGKSTSTIVVNFRRRRFEPSLVRSPQNV